MRFSHFIPAFFICALFFCACSCNSRMMGEFTPEELSWLVYSKDDTLVFADASGNKHRLLVDYRSDFSQLKNYYPIEAEIEIFNPDDRERFRIYLLKDVNVFKKYLRISDVYRSFDLQNPVDSVEIAGKLFNSVYVFTEDTAVSKAAVWRVYFNTQHGILRYDKRDETRYERLFDEPNV